jgi:hypothetical protein
MENAKMKCDKCNHEVPSNNDATILDFYISGSEFSILGYQSRHLLPVIDSQGEVICEGSPSRAQYLKGQPRDKRGYKYDSKMESTIRIAYQKMIENKE